MAQRYGTIAAHTRRRASVLVVFVVFCVHMHSFAGLIRLTPPPTFSDTAITDRHSDITIFQLRAHWVRIGKIVRTCAPCGSRTLDFLRARRAPYPQASADILPSGTSVNIAHDITTSGLFPFNGRVYNANNHRNRGVNNAKLKVHCYNMVSCATPLVVYFPPLLGEPPTILS